MQALWWNPADGGKTWRRQKILVPILFQSTLITRYFNILQQLNCLHAIHF